MRPIRVLYLLVAYVILQFCWWAYLLTEQSDEVFHQKIELVRLQSSEQDPDRSTIDSLRMKSTHRKWMVIGEGCVFLSLLLWGSFITYRSFRKEYELARLQKNFLLSVTHEFKSPLAAIRLYLETIQRRDLQPEQQKNFISNALHDTERLNLLVENALMANVIEHAEHVFYKEPFDLSSSIRSQLDRYKMVPGFPQIESDIQSGLSLEGDRNALATVVANLVENAAKYSPAGHPIRVELHSKGKGIVLRVIDSGMGVPDTEKERIFQKFYRVGNEMTRSTKGTGLGLYLSRIIVRKHGGEILVKDNQPAGTVFEVRLAA
jgi:two-component system, OmpR family, phosphate regulon sensor histidine kinase PhoR